MSATDVRFLRRSEHPGNQAPGSPSYRDLGGRRGQEADSGDEPVMTDLLILERVWSEAWLEYLGGRTGHP